MFFTEADFILECLRIRSQKQDSALICCDKADYNLLPGSYETVGLYESVVKFLKSCIPSNLEFYKGNGLREYILRSDKIWIAKKNKEYAFILRAVNQPYGVRVYFQPGGQIVLKLQSWLSFYEQGGWSEDEFVEEVLRGLVWNYGVFEYSKGTIRITASDEILLEVNEKSRAIKLGRFALAYGKLLGFNDVLRWFEDRISMPFIRTKRIGDRLVITKDRNRTSLVYKIGETVLFRKLTSQLGDFYVSVDTEGASVWYRGSWKLLDLKLKWENNAEVLNIARQEEVLKRYF